MQLGALGDKNLGKEDKQLWNESEKIKKLDGLFKTLEISGNELENAAAIIRKIKQVFDTNAPLIQGKINQITKTLAPHPFFTNELTPLKEEEIQGKVNQYFRGKDAYSEWKYKFSDWWDSLKKEVGELFSLFGKLRRELEDSHTRYSDFEKYYGEEIKPLQDMTSKLNSLVEGSEKLKYGRHL